MRIVIIATGSRGDIEPYIALGKGLAGAGNYVRFVSHENYETLLNAQGMEFWPVEGNIQDIVQSSEMRERIEAGNFLMLMSQMSKEAERGALALAEGGLAACRGMDLVLAGMGGLYVGLALAEKLDLPMVQAYVLPFTPTHDFPGVLLPQSLSRLGGSFNRLSHHLTRQVLWQGFRSADGMARQKVLRLPKAPFWGPYNSDRLRNSQILYGFSPAVISRPSDWEERIHVTGYWLQNSVPDWTPPQALVEFLEKRPPPLYIGFGSMSNRNPKETASLVLEALGRVGQRAILLSGWGGMQTEDLPETVFIIDSIPHAWLFPRVAAVVHHGGAGTTAAGLRAGIPSILIPFFGDQPFWGERITELGVGPAAIPRKKLTVERLSTAIDQAIHDSVMRQQAAELGSKIRAEDGVAQAVAVIQQMCNQAIGYPSPGAKPEFASDPPAK